MKDHDSAAIRPTLGCPYPYEHIVGKHDPVTNLREESHGRRILQDREILECRGHEFFLCGRFVVWPKKMSELGIKIRVITPQHKSTEAFMDYDKKFGHLIKTVPYSLYSAKSSIEAGDTFVRVVLFKSLQAVVIESAELAESLRQIFDIVWSKV
ncbi:MAG: hypothetical protein KGI45_02140 [Patescibacteria group bacterium]|nr:hypothetical protein [Patescibacteria group bacterium]MDE1966852.1 hypothetical protein [Patescibacteria group bacterium]